MQAEQNFNEKFLNSIYDEDIDLILSFLEDKQTDINYIDKTGNTPLLLSVATYNPNIAKIILDAGANPKEDRGYTLPLMAAVDLAVEATKNIESITEDSTEMIELLLLYGADIFQKDNSGRNAYDLAKGYHIPAQILFDQRK